MPVVRRRDQRFAFRGLWTGARAAVQPTAVFAFKWWFLARGACSRFCGADHNILLERIG